jgi:hypothetical protein
MPVLRQNRIRAENHAIPCRYSSKKNLHGIAACEDSLPRERLRRCVYRLGMEKPRHFRDTALIRIRPPERNDGADLRVDHEKGCDPKLRNESCRQVSASRVRGGCDPRGSSGHIRRPTV